jgi:hypothetical protein
VATGRTSWARHEISLWSVRADLARHLPVMDVLMATAKDEYIPTMPDDPNLLSAIAKVAVNHGYHDLELKMALKSMLKLKPRQARKKYRYAGSTDLRSLKEGAVNKGIGAGAMRRLDSFIKRSLEATRKRNKIVHASGVDTKAEGVPCA